MAASVELIHWAGADVTGIAVVLELARSVDAPDSTRCPCTAYHLTLRLTRAMDRAWAQTGLFALLLTHRPRDELEVRVSQSLIPWSLPSQARALPPR